MLGDQLDRDNDLFSLAAITLDRSLQGCESGVLEDQGFAEPSGVKGGSVFSPWHANKHLGDHQCERSRCASQPLGFLLL
jgi:hypothetical protein